MLNYVFDHHCESLRVQIAQDRLKDIDLQFINWRCIVLTASTYSESKWCRLSGLPAFNLVFPILLPSSIALISPCSSNPETSRESIACCGIYRHPWRSASSSRAWFEGHSSKGQRISRWNMVPILRSIGSFWRTFRFFRYFQRPICWQQPHLCRKDMHSSKNDSVPHLTARAFHASTKTYQFAMHVYPPEFGLLPTYFDKWDVYPSAWMHRQFFYFPDQKL